MSLIQQTLPHYDVHEIHSIEIHATPERVYEALKQYRMGSSPCSVFFRLRKLGGLPSLLLRRQPLTRNWNLEEPSILNLKPFVVVAEVPNEEVVWVNRKGFCARTAASESERRCRIFAL